MNKQASASDAPAGTLAGVTGHLLRRAHTIFGQHWQARFRDWKLTPVHGGILIAVGESPGITQTRLARHLGVEAPTVQHAIDKLEKLGCLRRTRPAGERRAWHLELTPEGHRALAAVRAFARERENELLAPLDAAERQMLQALLARLVAHGQELVRALPNPRAAEPATLKGAAEPATLKGAAEPATLKGVAEPAKLKSAVETQAKPVVKAVSETYQAEPTA